MIRKFNHIHFVGIGGIGMSGIAEVLLNMNYQISGSDLVESKLTRRLQRLGVKIYKGHNPSHISGADVVVYSSAVPDDNVELQEAKRRQAPVIPRAEMLAELMRMKFSIAIAGAHGKTSTTAMVAMVLDEAGLDPTFVVGGRLMVPSRHARLGQGEILVAEVDESDRTFLKISPIMAVVTSIDREHLDYYRDLEDIKDTFVDFVNKVPFYGTVILCLDQPNIQSIIPRIERRIITYGFCSQADLVAAELKMEGFHSDFEVTFRGDKLGQVRLKLPGEHNVLNSLAVIAVALDLGIDFPTISKALREFQGTERRLQLKGTMNDIMVIDDYGHHPTEIQVTLNTLKTCWNRRTVVVFQPHRYSRTKHLLQDFARSFYQADLLVVTEIYPAGERPIKGVNGELIARAIKNFGHKRVVFINKLMDIPIHLKEVIQPGDILLTLGAGDVWRVGEAFLQLVKTSPKR